MENKTAKIRILSGILAVLLCASSYSLVRTELFPSPRFDTSLETSQRDADAPNSTVDIVSTSELDAILGYETIDLESTYKAIDENPRLTPEERMLSKYFAHTLIEKYPSIEMRVFFENSKHLWFETLPKEEYNRLYPNCGVAHFNAKDYRISMVEGATIETKLHELGHAAWSFDWTIDGVRYKREEVNPAGTETMNNHLISASADDGSYREETKIVDYLWSYYPEFTIEDYSRDGLSPLISELSNEFGKKKIDTILDNLTRLYRYKRYKDEASTVEDYIDLVPACFELATASVEENPNLGYKPFVNFITILTPDENTFAFYLEKYNLILNALNVPTFSNEKLNELIGRYSNIDTFLITDDGVVPISRRTIKSTGPYIFSESLPEYIGMGDPSKDQTVNIDCELWNIKLKSSLLVTGEVSVEAVTDEIFLREKYFKNRQGFEYVSFILNGQTVCSNRIDNIWISIGIRPNGERGCILYTRDGAKFTEILRTAADLKRLSYPIRFNFFTKFLPKNDGKVYLSTLLDDYPLYEINKPLSTTEGILKNVRICDGTVEFVWPLKIRVGDYAYAHDILTSELLKYPSEKEVVIFPIVQPIGIIDNFPSDGINLYDLFTSQGLLEDEEFLSAHLSKNMDNLIVLSEDELYSIIENYVEEMNPKTHIMTPQNSDKN